MAKSETFVDESLFWVDYVTETNNSTQTDVQEYNLVRNYVPDDVICKLENTPSKYRKSVMMTYPKLPPYEIKYNETSKKYEFTQPNINGYDINTYYVHDVLDRIRSKYDEYKNKSFIYSDFYKLKVPLYPLVFNELTGEEYDEHSEVYFDSDEYDDTSRHQSPNLKREYLKGNIEKKPNEFYENFPKIQKAISVLRKSLSNREAFLMNKFKKDFLVIKESSLMSREFYSQHNFPHYVSFIPKFYHYTMLTIDGIINLVKDFNVNRKITFNNITDASFLISTAFQNDIYHVEITSCALYESENPEYLLKNDNFKYDFNFHNPESNVYNLSTLKNGYQRDLYAICVLYFNIMSWNFRYGTNGTSRNWYMLSDNTGWYRFDHKLNQQFLHALYLFETDTAEDSLNIGNVHELPGIEHFKFRKFLEEKHKAENFKRQRVEQSGIHLKEFQDPDIYSSDSDMPIDSDSD